jgi:multicomponent Na+:H+ antiporter subunit E
MLELNNKIVKILLLGLFTVVLGGSFCFSAIIKCFGVVVASVWLGWLLLRGEKYDPIGLKIGPNLFAYLVRLIKEIFLSTVTVCKAIFFIKKSELHPILAEIETGQMTDEAKVLFGNSITLTPGTITVDIAENKVIIHAITPECLEGCEALDLAIMKSQR